MMNREQWAKKAEIIAAAAAKEQVGDSHCAIQSARRGCPRRPRFQAVLDAHGDATPAAADAAHVFAASQSAEAAEALSDAALAYRDSLLAISAAGDEIKRRALAGELH